jgi:cytochrome c2
MKQIIIIIVLAIVIGGGIYFMCLPTVAPKPIPPKPQIDRSEIEALESRISLLLSEIKKLTLEYRLRKYNWSKCHKLDDYIDYVLSDEKDKGMVGAKLIPVDDSAEKLQDIIHKSVNESHRLESIERSLGYTRRRYKKIATRNLNISKSTPPQPVSSFSKSGSIKSQLRNSSSGAKVIKKLSKCHDVIESARKKRRKILKKLNVQRKECRALIVKYRKAIKERGVQLLKQLKTLKEEKGTLEKELRDKQKNAPPAP